MVKNIAIVSLSSGTIGEAFAAHEVEIGIRRLKEYGLNVIMMPHAQKGIEYVKKHPEDRAKDLLQAFSDDSIDMILCAIGGDDTYHLMLHKLGLNTFYGQSFLADICEMDHEMLPYTATYFEELIRTGKIAKIEPSDVWYEERTDWSPAAVGTPRTAHPNEGFLLLQGSPVFQGKILGGCLEVLYDIFDNSRYADSVSMCEKYELFPPKENWAGKILLLETCEEQPVPQLYRKMVQTLKKTGIFEVISGIICGKPMDELYFEEYKKILVEEVADPTLPIVANVNIGHATPRCIIPFGVDAVVDANRQQITFSYEDK